MKYFVLILLAFNYYQSNANIENDSLENIINRQIRHNNVKGNTLRQIYSLITNFADKNPVKALQYSFKLEYYAKKLNDNDYIAISYNRTGFILFNQGLYDDALGYYIKACDLFRKHKNMNELGFTLNDIGNVYYYTQKTDSALTKYREAISIFSVSNNYEGLALSYNNIGFLYNYHKNYDSAKICLNKALEYRRNLSDKRLVAHSMEFIGTFFTALKMYDSAEYYYTSALKIFTNMKISIHFFDCLASYSKMEIQKGGSEIKIDELLNKYYISKIIQKYPQGLSVYYDIANSYYFINKFSEAEYYAKQAIENARIFNEELILRESYLLLSKIYEKSNIIPLSFKFYKKYSALKDSISLFSEARLLAEIEQRNYSLAKDNEIKELIKEQNINRKILTFFGIFLITLIIGIVIIYRYSRQKAKLSYMLDNIMNSLTHPFIVIDVNNFDVVMANPAAYSSDVPIIEKEKSGKCYYSVCRLENSCHEYGMKCPVHEIKQTLKSLTTEHRYINIDKKEVFREIHAFPLFDKKGNLTMVIEYMFDITNRKNLEEELKKFKVAVTQAPSDIVITNFKGLIEYVNPKFERTTGYSFDEAKGKNPRILKSGFMPKETIKNLWDTILSGKEWSGELINKKKDGSFYWEAAYISPLLDANNKIINFIKVGEDVSKRKKAEEALIKSEQDLRTANEAKDKLLEEIAEERDKSEKLLLNILPRSIADRLKAGESPIADHFDEASVMFLDLTGFTQYSSASSPQKIVGMLNEIFTKFDKVSAKYGIEKIKTIGDNYMAASGIPVANPNHAEAMAKMALEIRDLMSDYITKEGEGFEIRIGLHCGPVVAGVIGEQKFIYDLWGDTVNTASRMESTGVNGKIQCTEMFKDVLHLKAAGHLMKFEERGEIEIKGKGMMRTWFLENI